MTPISRNIKEECGDDSFRIVRHFLYWETAWLEGFKPDEMDIPRAARTHVVKRIAKSAAEKALLIFSFWLASLLICAGILRWRPRWLAVQ